MSQRVSRLQAATILGVSLATIDRRIGRGELQVKVEPHGSNRRVWVLLEEDVFESSGDELGEFSSEFSGEDSLWLRLRPQVTALEEQLRARDELVAILRERLVESDASFQMLMARLEDAQRHADDLSTRMLPPGRPDGGRWWWPFRRG